MPASNQNFYSYAEARTALQALGIRSQLEYLERHCEDPRLPAKPDQFYSGTGWTDWYAFVGNVGSDLYPTYAEARAVIQTLGIQNRPDYLKRHSEDPRLPVRPDRFYAGGIAGWEDWNAFLGDVRSNPYPTYAEAQAVVRALSIKKT